MVDGMHEKRLGLTGGLSLAIALRANWTESGNAADTRYIFLFLYGMNISFRAGKKRKMVQGVITEQTAKYQGRHFLHLELQNPFLRT